MLDIYMPMMKSSAIVAAVRLGLFEALAQGPLDAATLAAKAGADPSRTQLQMDPTGNLALLKVIK